MPKLLVTLLLGLILLSSPMMVKAAEIEGGEVLKFGIFKTEVIRTEAAPGAAIGTKGVVKNQKLVEQTARIPAHKGVEFGFEYDIKGQSAGDTVEVTNKYLASSGNESANQEIIHQSNYQRQTEDRQACLCRL